MGRFTRRSILMWVGTVVSLIFAYVAVRDVNLDALTAALAEGDFWMLVPSAFVLALAVLLRAVRWRILLSPRHRPSTRVVMNALLIGYLFNTILPARAGEAARVVALKRRAGTPTFEALGTVAAERALDVLVLLAFFFVTAPVLPAADWLPSALVFGALLFGALTVSLVAFAVYGERPARFLLRPLTALPGISRVRTEAGAANLIRGFALFRRRAIALRATALTAVSWLLVAFSFWLVLLSFGVDLGFEAGLLVVVATNLAMIVPSGPAAVGVFEAATIVALAPFGVDRATALSYGIIVHALSALPFIPIGYLALHNHAAAMRREAKRRRAQQLASAGEETASLT
jgi:uncharacterized protein (TIRG00374 family)